MRVFVTGATGFIGSAVIRELIDAGHQVLGLARSDAGAAALTAAGAETHRGTLEDLDSLRSGAAAADGVIHTAFIHDFSDYAAAAETDRRAIEAIGETLAGTDRPLVVASGMAALTPGRLATEEDAVNPNFPRVSEQTALPLATRGVRVSVLRLPPSVHGEGDHGFVAQLISTARAKGISAYPGDGSNRWPAVHRLDAAQLFRLAMENAPTGARLHAVGDEGIPVRDIAEVIGRHLGLPVNSVAVEQAFDHFGFIGGIFAMDMGASSALTQSQLDWHPSQPGLIADLEEGHYFKD
jgi:nucleoside-diphosphate-sugar epimerase